MAFCSVRVDDTVDWHALQLEQGNKSVLPLFWDNSSDSNIQQNISKFGIFIVISRQCTGNCFVQVSVQFADVEDFLLGCCHTKDPVKSYHFALFKCICEIF